MCTLTVALHCLCLCIPHQGGSLKHHWLGIRVKESQKTTLPVMKGDKSEDLEGVWVTLKCRNALAAYHSEELTTRCKYRNRNSSICRNVSMYWRLPKVLTSPLRLKIIYKRICQETEAQSIMYGWQKFEFTIFYE